MGGRVPCWMGMWLGRWVPCRMGMRLSGRVRPMSDGDVAGSGGPM